MNAPTFTVLPATVLAAVCCAPLWAEDAAAPFMVNWKRADVSGKEVAVPSPTQPTVMAFVMAGQDRSLKLIAQVQDLLGKAGGVQVVAVVSGPDAERHAKELRDETKWAWPIVADPSHQSAGELKVHAWPTTLVIDTKGEQVAHLGGLSPSFAHDLDAYVQFALGRFSREVLAQKLRSHTVSESNTGEAASRRLNLAERLLARGATDAARAELLRGLEQHPDDPRLKLALARVHLASDQPAEALQAVNSVEPSQVGLAQLNTVRGKALVMLNRWDEARAALSDALRLNPDPAEAHYLLGRIAEHDAKWEDAAKHYRAAFEGKK